MSGDKKPVSQWNMRWQNQNTLNLADFEGKINWEKELKDKLYMYWKEEELREEEVDEDDLLQKDAEYFKNKKNKKRLFYKKQKNLILSNEYPSPEDLNSSNVDSNIFQYEGKEYNADLLENIEGTSVPNPTLSSLQAASSTSTTTPSHNHNNSYVLLQFVNRVENNQTTPEINIIPVENMFKFKKNIIRVDPLLEEIEEKYLEKTEMLAKQALRYRKISSAFLKNDTDKDTSKRSDETSDASDPFQMALKLLKNNAKNPKNIQKGILKNSLQGASLFSLNTGSKMDRVEFDDNGMDVKELKKESFSNDDYVKRFADDEEDHIVIEQNTNNKFEENERSSSWRYDEEDIIDEDEDEDEDEEDEEEKKADESSSSSFGQSASISKSGLVSENMIADVRAATKTAQNIQQKSQDAINLARSEGSKVKVSGTVSSDASSISSKRSSETESDALKKKAKMESASLSSLGADYDLTDEGIRRFIRLRGGKVSTKDITEFFKPKMKIYSKEKNDKAAGKNLFISIIKRITKTLDDPIAGLCVVLK